MSRPWHAFYPPHLSPTAGYPDIPVWGLLERAAEQHPERTALIGGERTWTYGTLWAECLARAGGIAGAGVVRGDRVLLQLANSAGFVTCLFGAWRAGAIVSPASPALSDEQRDAQIDDVEPAMIIDEQDQPAHGPEPPPPIDIDPATGVAVLQYTSGTTGRAKGAMMSHRNLVANALQNARWFGWGPDEVTLGVLPLCHTWGLSCALLSTIAVGGALVLVPRFDEREVTDLVAKHRATVLYGSATMFDRLLDWPEPVDLSSLRHVKAGAMLVHGDLKARWDARHPDAPMQRGYGLTEASPESHDNPPHRIKPGTVGVPIQDTDCRIADPDEPERVVSTGEPGEVQLRGPQVTLGYWRRPDATAAAFADGWLRTGDLGVMDDEGYLTIVDRIKDLLKFRGYSIAPGTVEAVLLRHPAVAEAVVVGRPDPRDGDVPTAFVVRAEAVDTPALRDHCAASLARYEVPREWLFVDEIPKNLVGKPMRRLLRDRLVPGSS